VAWRRGKGREEGKQINTNDISFPPLPSNPKTLKLNLLAGKLFLEIKKKLIYDLWL
jgi:hypothetical protein